MNRILIPLPADTPIDVARSIVQALERNLPEYMVLVIGGMTGSAVIIPSDAEYISPEDR